MDVKIFPNWSRPGVGAKPRSERQRPLLPQHARHCPVLEAGNAMGFLVYPPLEQHEAFQVEYHGDGRYQFQYFLRMPDGKWKTIFTCTWTLPVGSIGAIQEEVEFGVPDPPVSKEGAAKMAGTFVVRQDLGTPAGAVTLRGAWNFQTPPGWDTVYFPVLNMIERPVAPALVVRVETDWYPHDTEIRYVLQPGEGLPGARHMAIGQALFVPREEVNLVECTEEEIEKLREEKDEFLQKKADERRTTPYGLEYSPHYIRRSREVNQEQRKRADPAPE